MSDMVPEADAIEQAQDVEWAGGADDISEAAGAAARAGALSGVTDDRAESLTADPEAPEADALEQAEGVREGDDEIPRYA